MTYGEAYIEEHGLDNAVKKLIEDGIDEEHFEGWNTKNLRDTCIYCLDMGQLTDLEDDQILFLKERFGVDDWK